MNRPLELVGTLININKEIEKLPQTHSEVWDIFKAVKNKYDAEAYSELLNDESIRHRFYEKLSFFIRLFKLAMSSVDFNDIKNEKLIDRYKKDAKFFLKLRVDVQRRYFDELDYSEYEAQVQKLIDKHITTEGEVLKITQLVNIFDKEQRENEVEKIQGKAAKADHIASRTIKAINVKMNEDSFYYTKLSALIKETIEEYRQRRIDEAEYLAKVQDLEKVFFSGKQANVPQALEGRPNAVAYFNILDNVAKEIFENLPDHKNMEAQLALELEDQIREVIYEDDALIVDWQTNVEIENALRIKLDDYLFDAQQKYEITIPFDTIDEIIEEVLKIAKVRYR